MIDFDSDTNTIIGSCINAGLEIAIASERLSPVSIPSGGYLDLNHKSYNHGEISLIYRGIIVVWVTNCGGGTRGLWLAGYFSHHLENYHRP